MIKHTLLYAAVTAFSVGAASSYASISASEVERLGADLTPLGAEKAGNSEGTIPAWTGGLTEALPGWPNKDNYRPNPYADDQPLFTITADNIELYADRLTEGTQAMLKAYPDAFKMNVYPSRRTAAYPQFYYDAIAQNALTAELVDGGNRVTNVWGSIPFPVPSNGHEVIWNHLLRYQGHYREGNLVEDIMYSNGNRLGYTFQAEIHHPFYDTNASAKDKERGIIFKYTSTTIEPARDAGEGTMAIDSLDMAGSPRKAWTYDPGERRVRRAPNLAFDTPDRPLNVIDDYELFSGSPERYDFNLVGKQEMYIPYNNNEVNSPRQELEALNQTGYMRADAIRYELHRVWVVEATLKDGQRHIYAKRRFYVDEDSWTIMASDKYDGNGNLWRVGFFYPVVAPEVPLTGAGAWVNVDLKKNGYYYSFGSIGKGSKGWAFNGKPRPASYYTPAALRRRGR
ncbi:MAG: DUF1329 domain-containing protein [Halopseudomonas sp.]